MESAVSLKYSIVIPVYNTTWVLGELQRRVEQVFSTQIKQSYEIILVDDCSPNPGTWSAIEGLVKQNEHINAILLARNSGQHAALLCGMAEAKGEYIITMDDDLQHTPEDIPKLIRLNTHDVVMGQFLQKKHSFFRNTGSGIKAYFDRVISGKPRNLHITTFCLFQREIVKEIITLAKTPHPLFSSLIFQVTHDVVGVQVSHSSRQEGRSGYSFIALTRIFGRVFVKKYNTIFQLAAWSGALLSCISLTILVDLIFINYWQNLIYLVLCTLLCIGLVIMFVGIRGVRSSHNKTLRQQKPYIIKQRIN